MAILMSTTEVKPLRESIGSVPYGADLLTSLREIILRAGVRTGTISFIGALQNATLLYYLQKEKRFHKNVFEGPLEIISGMGNIATLGDELVVHCHVVLADKEGSCYGGHLAEGSKVFAAEVHLRELSPQIQRKFDEVTGLNLLQV